MPTARLLVALPLLALVAACRKGPLPLATVGRRPVTVEEVGAAVTAQTGKALKDVPPELCAALFEGYLEEEVVLASSDRPQDRELPAPLRTARARDLLASLCPPPPLPTEAEVATYLNADAQPATERLRLRQLVLPDEAGAQKARERVRAGEDFLSVSRELSRAPNAETGGTLGWVERGQLPPEFEAAVFGLSAGEVSNPVASNAGWHVFQLIERGNGGGDRDRARAELAARNAERGRTDCVKRLAARVGVSVNCDAAPFPCRNPYEATP